MVVIAAVLGYMGWSSIGKVAARVENVDDADRLLKWAEVCRIREKNFMLRGDKKYQQDNDATMKDIFTLCDELSASFDQQNNKDEVAAVKKAAQDYKQGFDAWVDLYDRGKVQEEAMVAAARLVRRAEPS